MTTIEATQQDTPATEPGIVLWAVAALIVVLVITTVYLAVDILLILFLAVLFGVFLAKSSQHLARMTSLPAAVALTVVTIALLTSAVGGITMFGAQIDDQLGKAGQQIDRGVDQLKSLADRQPVVRTLLTSLPFANEVFEIEPDQQQQEKTTDNKAELAQQSALRTGAKRGAQAVAGIFRTTFGLVVNSALIFFVGLFLANSPEDYMSGFVRLFPAHRRERTHEIVELMGDSLWRWLLGRFGSMLITGTGASLVLLAVDVPMAVSLGVATALLTFIPNIGGFIALVLALLFAAPLGGSKILVVLLGYIALQLIESYLVTPLIQQKQVSLPPALLIAFQALMGVLCGFLGAAVASPLLATVKVGLEEAYVKDILENN